MEVYKKKKKKKSKRAGFANNFLAPCGLASLATSRLGPRRGIIGSIMTCHDALSRCGRAILRRLTDMRLWQHPLSVSATLGAKDPAPAPDDLFVHKRLAVI